MFGQTPHSSIEGRQQYCDPAYFPRAVEGMSGAEPLGGDDTVASTAGTAPQAKRRRLAEESTASSTEASVLVVGADSRCAAAGAGAGLMGTAVSIAVDASETAMIAIRSCKMVLVVRTDLGMGKGKMCAQCAHAAIEAYKQAFTGTPRQKKCLTVWDNFGSTKIAVKANSEAELLGLYERARERGIVAAYIRDAGHTQVAPGSVTVLAIGPEEVGAVDSITSHLKLL